MHIQTHALAGWCMANLVPLAPRDRFLCMLAATLPDIDGLSILLGQHAYWDYHHLLAHNLPFALAASLLLAAFSSNRLKATLVYLAAMHLHFLLDYFGSGPFWKIPYFWPFSNWGLMFENAWDFYSWQNISAALAFVAGVVLIAWRLGRTPLEWIMPSLDRQLISPLRRP